MNKLAESGAESGMANRDLLAIGASAGGLEALRFLLGRFPADFQAAVLVTLHLSSHYRSELDIILSRAGPLPAVFATDGQALEKSRIYIAPPRHHLLVDGGQLSVGVGPRENHARPAIDPMLRSTAACCGHRAIGAVLTGTLYDGASGLWALKQCGGITAVQDPSDAAYPEMPATAISRVNPDHVVRLADLPDLLQALVIEPAGKPMPLPECIQYEIEVARNGHGSMGDIDRIGQRSILACPDCGGVVWELEEGDGIRYRCHTGHAYSADLMNVALDESLRKALGTALRTLQERGALAQRLHQQAVSRGHNHSAHSWQQQVREFEEQEKTIRDSIRRMDKIAARYEQKQSAQ
jgi:two-component system, chemotaxis family, protein-glutamate methylesterase/glutaminase